MPIKINISPEEMVRKVMPPMEDIERRCILALRRAMYEAVNYAKGLNTYKDKTGNLRSSILFQTYKDGTLVDSFSSGGQGAEEGKKVADAEKDKSAKQIYSVIVAGMHYASYVEAKGYDVLTGAELRLETIVKPYLEEALKDTGLIIREL